MYHRNFPYYLELPKTELPEFLECIRKGKYRMVAGHGMIYENDVWVLKWSPNNSPKKTQKYERSNDTK